MRHLDFRQQESSHFTLRYEGSQTADALRTQILDALESDYRALSNAGVWCIGRLQTDADRARVLDGLAANIGTDRTATAALARTVQRLAPRWFVIRDAHVNNGIALFQPRWAMSLLRGPMTRTELKRARDDHARVIGRGENTTGRSVLPESNVVPISSNIVARA